MTITVDVAADAPASIINRAIVAGGGDVLSSDNTAEDLTVVAAGPDLTLVKSHANRCRTRPIRDFRSHRDQRRRRADRGARQRGRRPARRAERDGGKWSRLDLRESWTSSSHALGATRLRRERAIRRS